MRYNEAVESGKQGWESIWSVPSRWRLIYSVLFGLQVAIVLGLVVWYETVDRTTDGLLESVMAVGRNMAPMVITIAALNLIITEGVNYLVVLSESFRLRVEAKKEALRQEGVERGKAEGKAEMAAEMAARFEAWNERRLEAERLGREFTEPPAASLAGSLESR